MGGWRGESVNHSEDAFDLNFDVRLSGALIYSIFKYSTPTQQPS